MKNYYVFSVIFSSPSFFLSSTQEKIAEIMEKDFPFEKLQAMIDK